MSTNQLQTWEQQNQVLVSRGIDEPMWNALKNSIFPGAQDYSILMAVDYCRARQLDIMLKPVHIVPMYVNDKQTGQKGTRDVVMPGIGMYRIQAERAGNYAGADAVEFGPVIKKTFSDNNGNSIEFEFPEYAEMKVYKTMPNGQIVSFAAKEYWEENYATAGRDTEMPNSMWRKRPRAQLAKCVEAQCLRRGWPETGQDVTAEEMEGKQYQSSMKTVSEPAEAIQNTQAQQSISQESKPVETGNYIADDVFAQRLAIWQSGLKDGSVTIQSISDFLKAKGYDLSELQRSKLEAATK